MKATRKRNTVTEQMKEKVAPYFLNERAACSVSGLGNTMMQLFPLWGL